MTSWNSHVKQTLTFVSFLAEIIMDIAAQMCSKHLDLTSAVVKATLSKALTSLGKHLFYGITPDTLNTYGRAWSRWCEFMHTLGLTPLDGDPLLVSLHLAEILEDSLEDQIGASRMQSARSAVNFFYTAAGRVSPTVGPQVALLMRSASRVLTAQPLERDLLPLEGMTRLLEFHVVDSPTCSLRTLMHLTVFLLMYLGLFRFSDAAMFLVHEDLLRFEYKDGVLDGVMIYICKSKTDQGWVGKWVALGATGTRFCPVRLLQRLLEKGRYVTFHESDDCGPLLRAVRAVPGGHVLSKVTSPMASPISSLSYTAFNTSLKELVTAAGILGHITCHSARISGSTVYYLLPDVELQLVRSLGRWAPACTFDRTYARPLALARDDFFRLTRSVWRF